MKPYFAVSAIGGLQGIILAVVLYIKGRKKPSIVMLSLYTLFFSAGLFENWLAANNKNFLSGALLMLLANSSYLYGPLLYLFVQYLVHDTRRFRKKDLIHFIPFILLFTANFLLTGLKVEFTRQTNDLLEIILFEFLVIQILTYNIRAIRKLKQHYNYILHTYSNLEKRDLNWLKIFLIIITSIYCLSFLLSHLIALGVKGAAGFLILIQIAITCFIYLMSYIILSSPHLFAAREETETDSTAGLQYELQQPFPEKNENLKAMPINEKYKKSGLKLELALQYLGLLEQLMKEKKPYKKPDLNIQTLSLQLGITKNHLTQVINEQLKMNFFEFINTYRVEEAKRLLLDSGYSNLSLSGIAVEAGYKSKATFFSNFKKITGFTPLEWQKKNNMGS